MTHSFIIMMKNVLVCTCMCVCWSMRMGRVYLEPVSGNGVLENFALTMYVDRDTNNLARMLAIFYGVIGKVSCDSSLMKRNITCLYPIGCRLKNRYQIHIINYLHSKQIREVVTGFFTLYFGVIFCT